MDSCTYKCTLDIEQHSLFKTLESYTDLGGLQVGKIHFLSSSCKVPPKAGVQYGPSYHYSIIKLTLIL